MGAGGQRYNFKLQDEGNASPMAAAMRVVSATTSSCRMKEMQVPWQQNERFRLLVFPRMPIVIMFPFGASIWTSVNIQGTLRPLYRATTLS